MAKLNKEEIVILNEIAKTTGCDCWFSLDYEGNFKDLEGLTKSLRKGVQALIESYQFEDFAELSTEEKYHLVTALGSILN